MTSYSQEYRRRARSRQPRREQQQVDAVAVALTAQVVVCIVLLLLALLVKKMDEERYTGVKTQYSRMVTDPAESEELMRYFADNGGGVQGFFASIEQALSSLLSRWTGGAYEEPPAPPADEDLEEPAPPTDDAGPGGDTAPLPALSFDYLLDGDDVPAEEPDSEALGQGGEYPVDTGGADYASLSPPDNATFAPVYLAASVQPPVTGIITSDFAYRDHPISGNEDFHNGMDIAAEEGRDILAAMPGEVVEVGWSDIYGNYITVQHAANLSTFYAHCSEIIASEGMQVRQGERIAKVGQTGTVTGPHLHFSVVVEGRYVNPYWVLQDNIKVVG